MTDKMLNKNLLELERRVKRLERDAEKANYCYYIKQIKGQSSAFSQEFNFKFKVHAFTYLKLKITMKTTVNALDLILKVNGVKAREFKRVEGDNQLEVVLPFEEGLNKVTVIAECENIFLVNDCQLETQGNISYVDEEYLLQVINEEERSLILAIFDERLTISEYKSSEISSKFSLYPVKGASICSFGENYLLAVIDGENRCRIILFNEKIQKLKDQMFGDNIISICSLGGENARVFAVKGNSIYQYNVNGDLTFTLTNTGLKGKKVNSTPNVNDYIIIIDYNGNAKLVQI